jgi:hypothetical protein
MMKAGKTVLVLSNHSFYAPPDSSVVLSQDVNILTAQVSRELKKQSILYLGKSLDERYISGFTDNEIKEIINTAKCDHILIEADKTQSRSLSGFDHLRLKTLSLANRCILLIGADVLNQPNTNAFIKTKEKFWKNIDLIEPVHIVEWLKSHKFVKHLAIHNVPLTVFINKVENIFYKNVAINFGRQLKQSGIEKILYGSIYNSEYQYIK